MATTNYNLPTISGNMTADVVRDHNALAEAVDTAIKTAVGSVDLTEVEQAVESVDNRVTTHLAENASTTTKGHVQLSNDTNNKSETLAPTMKALNEVKQYANDGKTVIATAIVGKGGKASSSDTFTQLANSISLLGGGVKSVQRGLVSFAADSTLTKSVNISEIDIKNSIVLLDYMLSNSNIGGQLFTPLLTPTTLSLTRGVGYTTVSELRFQVIEFDEVRSKQTISKTTSSGNVTISAVDVSKAIVIVHLKHNKDTSGGSNYSEANRVAYLANSTTVYVNVPTDKAVEVTVIEFK